MKKKTTCRLMAALMLLVVLTTGAIASAETTATLTPIDKLLRAFDETPEGHIEWEPEILEVDATYELSNPVFTLPGDDDMSQEDALRIALETIFALTDKTADDIYNTYRIKFSFCEQPGINQRFWRIAVDLAPDKMGAEAFVIDVESPSGRILQYTLRTD